MDEIRVGIAGELAQESRDQREPIAGVTPVHVSDEPPYSYFNKELGSHVAVIARNYALAQRRFRSQELLESSVQERGLFDSRVCMIRLQDESMLSAPDYDFLVTDALTRELQEAKNVKGEDLSQDELLGICLSAGEDAVNPTFTADAMNAVNASYYASDIAFDASAQLATMFVENEPLNIAIGSIIADSTSGDTLRIKEISSGNNTGHWQKIMQGIENVDSQRHVEITLSDFVEPRIAHEISGSDAAVKVSAEVYSLFDDMPELPEKDRFDTIISTYSFDSVWQPEDMRLKRVDGQWYKTKYRVKVADWAPRREELISAMRELRPLADATAADYDGIVVETAMDPVDISDHPFYEYIVASDQNTIDFPGGLIKRIVNAFDSQLKKGGVFITADVADFGENTISKIESDRHISGVAARYKAEDYALAKRILEAKYGLEVNFIGLAELADGYLQQDWRGECSENERKQIDNLPSNKIMLVKRRKESRADV